MSKTESVEYNEISVDAMQGGLPTGEKDIKGRPKLTEPKPVKIKAMEITLPDGSTFVT